MIQCSVEEHRHDLAMALDDSGWFMILFNFILDKKKCWIIFMYYTNEMNNIRKILIYSQ